MSNAPGTVHSRNGEGVVTGIVQQLDEVVAGDDTRGDDITERHGYWFSKGFDNERMRPLGLSPSDKIAGSCL